jgi:hypothetical protein
MHLVPFGCFPIPSLDRCLLLSLRLHVMSLSYLGTVELQHMACLEVRNARSGVAPTSQTHVHRFFASSALNHV